MHRQLLFLALLSFLTSYGCKTSEVTSEGQLKTIHDLEDEIVTIQNEVITVQSQANPDPVEFSDLKSNHSTTTIQKNGEVEKFMDEFDEDYPEIKCGDFEDAGCVGSEWAITYLPNGASVTMVDSSYSESHSLYLYNPHDSTEINPPSISMESYITKIEAGKPYEISFWAKMNGYGDVVSAPSFAFYVMQDGNWLGEVYLGGDPGTYYSKDWTFYKKFFFAQSNSAFQIGLITLLDHVWIDDLQVIEKE